MVAAARSEARQALDLLPSEPNAQALLGAIAALHDYDWREAERRFQLAMASGLPPPSVRDVYAFCYLEPLGHYEEAVEEQAQSRKTL